MLELCKAYLSVCVVCIGFIEYQYLVSVDVLVLMLMQVLPDKFRPN